MKLCDYIVENKLLQLVFVAESNIQCCKKIQSYLNKIKGENGDYNEFINLDKTKFLIMTSNNCIFEAVNILKSVIDPDKNENDTSFRMLGEYKKFNDVMVDKFDKIKKDFRDLGYTAFRHNISAHKHVEQIGDPEAFVYIPIKQSFVNDLNNFVEQIKEIIYKDGLFKDPICNNYLLTSVKGLEEILNVVEKN